MKNEGLLVSFCFLCLKKHIKKTQCKFYFVGKHKRVVRKTLVADDEEFCTERWEVYLRNEGQLISFCSVMNMIEESYQEKCRLQISPCMSILRC